MKISEVVLFLDSGSSERYFPVPYPCHEERLVPGAPIVFSWSDCNTYLEISSKNQGGHKLCVDTSEPYLYSYNSGSFNLFLKSEDFALEHIIKKAKKLEDPDLDYHDRDDVQDRIHTLDLNLSPSAERSLYLARLQTRLNQHETALFHYTRCLTARNVSQGHFRKVSRALMGHGDDVLNRYLLLLGGLRFPEERTVFDMHKDLVSRNDHYRECSYLTRKQLLGDTDEEVKYTKMVSPPFTVIFNPEHERIWEMVQVTHQTLEAARIQLQGPFTRDQTWESVSVKLTPFLDRHSEQIRGYTKGNTMTLNTQLFRDSGQKEKYRATLKHELIHILSRQLVLSAGISQPPSWLYEGIAYVLTEKENPIPSEMIRMSLKTLEHLLNVQDERKPNILAHRFARAFADFLLRDYEEEEKISMAGKFLLEHESLAYEFEMKFREFKK